MGRAQSTSDPRKLRDTVDVDNTDEEAIGLLVEELIDDENLVDLAK